MKFLEDKMLVLVFEPGNVVFTKKVGGSLKSLQEIIGADYIRTGKAVIKFRKAQYFIGPEYSVVYDRLGLLNGKVENRGYYGTFFICKNNGLVLEGLTKQEIELIMEELGGVR
jgi:hypothetical protein